MIRKQNEKDGVIPNYLRTTTGSCHDHCKYGKKREFETKTGRYISKRATNPKIRRQCLVESVIIIPEKKTTLTQLKLSYDSKIPLFVNSGIPRYDASFQSKREVISKFASLNPGKENSSSKHVIVPDREKKIPADSLIPRIARHEISHQSKNVLVRSKPGKTKTGEKKLPFKRDVGKMVPASELENKASPIKQSVIRVSCLHSTNRSMMSKTEESKLNGKNVDSKRTFTKTIPFPNEVARSNSRKKCLKIEQNKDKEIVESVKIEIDTKDKIIPSVQTGSLLTRLSVTTSCHEDQQDFDYTSGATVDRTVEDDIENMNTAETSNPEKKGMWKGDGILLSKQKDDVSTPSLKFRRGKVIDLELENKGTPMKLRFMEERLLKERTNARSEAKQIHFRRGDIVGQAISNFGYEKIVLRQKGVQEKKDVHGLMNTVIRETASKLVETRKSKVKALVAAFESVASH